MEDKGLAHVVEELVNELQGVASARVVLDDKSNIVELHVLSDETRNPRQIVRDIETVLLVKMGLNIDHKKISVVQFADRHQEVQSKRISLRGIGYRLNSGMTEVSVALSLGESNAEVTVRGPNSLQNQTRLVANATVGSLKELLGGVIDFVVEDVNVLNFVRREVVLVGVSTISPNGEEMLVGATLVRGDIKEAVVKATLDAVNRRLQRMIG